MTFRRAQLRPVRLGEGVEGDQVLLGVLEQLGDLGDVCAEASEHLADPLAGLVAALGVEDLGQGGGDEPPLGGPAVLEHVADEVHGAALPGAREH
jgi:hypothetical protein